MMVVIMSAIFSMMMVDIDGCDDLYSGDNGGDDGNDEGSSSNDSHDHKIPQCSKKQLADLFFTEYDSTIELSESYADRFLQM
jgi:hypothetical protein